MDQNLKIELQVKQNEVILLLEHIKSLNNTIEELKNKVDELNDKLIDCHFEIYNKDKKIDELNRYNAIPYFFCNSSTRFDNRA